MMKSALNITSSTVPSSLKGSLFEGERRLYHARMQVSEADAIVI
jgi:hypothetical protein